MRAPPLPGKRGHFRATFLRGEIRTMRTRGLRFNDLDESVLQAFIDLYRYNRSLEALVCKLIRTNIAMAAEVDEIRAMLKMPILNGPNGSYRTTKKPFAIGEIEHACALVARAISLIPTHTQAKSTAGSGQPPENEKPANPKHIENSGAENH